MNCKVWKDVWCFLLYIFAISKDLSYAYQHGTWALTSSTLNHTLTSDIYVLNLFCTLVYMLFTDKGMAVWDEKWTHWFLMILNGLKLTALSAWFCQLAHSMAQYWKWFLDYDSCIRNAQEMGKLFFYVMLLFKEYQFCVTDLCFRIKLYLWNKYLDRLGKWVFGWMIKVLILTSEMVYGREKHLLNLAPNKRLTLNTRIARCPLRMPRPLLKLGGRTDRRLCGHSVVIFCRAQMKQ